METENRPQFCTGSKFIRELNLFAGAKVLDMGCGIGELTKYISDIVGSDVVGVDPDTARIAVAKERFRASSNIQFHVGHCAVGFPHDNEAYYDIHISSHVFHWLDEAKKKVYLQKAYDCLKPGGRLAILCVEMVADHEVQQHDTVALQYLTRYGYRKLLQDSALFKNITVKEAHHSQYFESPEELQRWSTPVEGFKSPYLKEILPKFVSHGKDGSVNATLFYVNITATKS